MLGEKTGYVLDTHLSPPLSQISIYPCRELVRKGPCAFSVVGAGIRAQRTEHVQEGGKMEFS